MGRPRKFSDDEFAKQYKQSGSMDDLAYRLNVGRVCVYQHCQRLSLPPVGNRDNDELCLKMFDAYNNSMTIDSLADTNNMSRGAARDHLRHAVALVWGLSTDDASIQKKYKPFHRFPLPRSLQNIKITHALIEDEALFDDPEKLSELTRVKVGKVKQFLLACFDKLSGAKGSLVTTSSRTGFTLYEVVISLILFVLIFILVLLVIALLKYIGGH